MALGITRKKGQSIIITTQQKEVIHIFVNDIRSNYCNLMFDAPMSIKIDRQDKIIKNGKEVDESIFNKEELNK